MRHWIALATPLLVSCLALDSLPRAVAEEPLLFNIVGPDKAGLDAEQLTGIDKLMNNEVESGRIVGCIVLVARGDKVGYLQTWGQSNREAEKPMTADTIFRIYSMTKPITSVAAMQLVEQGKMELDDPISKYLPALGKLKVLVDGDQTPAEREIIVRDLLRHTSGLTYGFFGNTDVDKAYRRAGVLVTDNTLEDTVRKLSSLPLLYQPGSRWHYSVSTDVTGRLVEVVSGQRLDEYLNEHILDPLGMGDTFFMVPEAKQPRFAQMYQRDGSGLKPVSPFESIRFLNPDNQFFSGGGGLCSTTKDYLRFCRALLNGGKLDGNRILKSKTLAQMTRNQLDQGAGRQGFQFGLGFAIGTEGEYSWGGVAGTRFWINPKRKLISIYMIQNTPDGHDYGNMIKALVYAADKMNMANPAPMP